jgi:peptidoglycan/LPS O-acetylase OafA/YrhL
MGWSGRQTSPTERTGPIAASAASGGGAQPVERHARRSDIEGLRAVAVLAVVLYHGGAGWAAGGYVGVDVFFVVSGFLITGLLLDELEGNGRVSFAHFYARRARRLLPASSVVLVATVLASWRWLAPLRARAVAADGIASGLYAVNYRFALSRTGYLDAAGPPSPLQHYWSLAVEEQFYLLWPLLLLALATMGRRRGQPVMAMGLAVLGVSSLVLSVVLTRWSQPWAFFSLPTRAWEFVVGGAVALCIDRARRLPGVAASILGWCGLSAIAGCILAYGPTTSFPGLAAAVPVLGTAAVVAAGCAAPGTARSGPARLLAARPLQRIGGISYGWYLWHFPLLVLPEMVAARPLALEARLALVAASAVPAIAMKVTVEDPLRSARLLVGSSRRTLALAAALTVVTAVASVVVVQTSGRLAGGDEVVAPPPELPGGAVAGADVRGGTTEPASADATQGPEDRAGAVALPAPDPDPTADALRATTEAAAAVVHASLAVAEVPANLEPALGRAHRDRAPPFVDGCFDDFRDTRVHRCTYGPANPAARVVLFGDSHATAWYPALLPAAEQRGWQLEVPSKATCPPLFATVYSPNFKREYTECERWRDSVLQRLADDPPMLVVLGFNRTYGTAYGIPEYGEEWLGGLARMVERLRSYGSQVVVLGPLPRQPDDVPTCLSQHLSSVLDCAPSIDTAYNAGGLEAERAVTEAAGGVYLDLRPLFCDATRCPVVVGNLLVFRDQNHLATPFATWLSPVMGAALDQVLAHPEGPLVAQAAGG